MEKEIEPKPKTLAQFLYLPPIYSLSPKGFAFANISQSQSKIDKWKALLEAISFNKI